MDRRTFLKSSLLSFATLGSLPTPCLSRSPNFPDVRKITNDNRQHWFGYYDKFQVDPTGRWALGMEVDDLLRSPEPDDRLTIGMIDLMNDFDWKPIGLSHAWGWQQGCMLQWLPGSDRRLAWNDRDGDRLVSRIFDTTTGETRTLPKPIYTISPDGRFALGTEFSRIQNMRPGYGYAGVPDPFEQVKAPDEIGIYKMDLETGDVKTIVSLKTMADMPHDGERLHDYWHYFNHLLVSPDSRRFIFLHRWRKEMGPRPARATGGFVTRMVTADISGEDIHVLDPSGNTSHFIWRDPTHVCAWTKPREKPPGFYLFTDRTDHFEVVGAGKMLVNGHNTYVPDTNNEWILNDTYPQGKDRLQELYLYHVPSTKKITLGLFHAPEQFRGEWRCDLHPRCDQQGNRVFFDSTHEGDRRQMYVIDIAPIVRG